MMNMAVQWGYLQINPVAKVKQLHEDNERMWVLTPQEEQRLLEECQKRPQKRVLPSGSGTIRNLYRDAARRDLQPYVGPYSSG